MCNFYVDDRCGFKTSYFTHVKWETQYSFRVLKYLDIYENGIDVMTGRKSISWTHI